MQLLGGQFSEQCQQWPLDSNQHRQTFKASGMHLTDQWLLACCACQLHHTSFYTIACSLQFILLEPSVLYTAQYATWLLVGETTWYERQYCERPVKIHCAVHTRFLALSLAKIIREPCNCSCKIAVTVAAIAIALAVTVAALAVEGWTCPTSVTWIKFCKPCGVCNTQLPSTLQWQAPYHTDHGVAFNIYTGIILYSLDERVAP